MKTYMYLYIYIYIYITTHVSVCIICDQLFLVLFVIHEIHEKQNTNISIVTYVFFFGQVICFVMLVIIHSACQYSDVTRASRNLKSLSTTGSLVVQQLNPTNNNKYIKVLHKWPFVRGMHSLPVNSLRKGQWCGKGSWLNTLKPNKIELLLVKDIFKPPLKIGNG